MIQRKNWIWFGDIRSAIRELCGIESAQCNRRARFTTDQKKVYMVGTFECGFFRGVIHFLWTAFRSKWTTKPCFSRSSVLNSNFTRTELFDAQRNSYKTPKFCRRFQICVRNVIQYLFGILGKSWKLWSFFRFVCSFLATYWPAIFHVRVGTRSCRRSAWNSPRSPRREVSPLNSALPLSPSLRREPAFPFQRRICRYNSFNMLSIFLVLVNSELPPNVNACAVCASWAETCLTKHQTFLDLFPRGCCLPELYLLFLHFTIPGLRVGVSLVSS